MSNRWFFIASLTWNIGHGMSWLTLPLYAAEQGLSNTEIGTLLALPVLAQAPLNLIGGAYTDRIGGRLIMLLSATAMSCAGLWLIVAQGFVMLFAGQIALVLSRAVFWPATWAMASELPGERGVQLGRLNAITNAGQIGGSVLSGALLVAAGFAATFATLAAMAVMAFCAAFATRSPVSKAPAIKHNLGYLPLLRKRVVHYCIMCAYLSAIPFALSLSFYPLLLAHYGYGEGASGVLLALRSVGSIGAALVVARFMRAGTGSPWPIASGLTISVAMGLTPFYSDAAAIAACLLLMGVGAGAMTLYFQITISDASQIQERGSALALGGIGWNISLFTTPLLMGFLADRYGLVAAFYVVAAFALLCTAMLAALRRFVR